MNSQIIELIDKLAQEQHLSKEEWITVISSQDEAGTNYLFNKAREIRERYYGRDVYMRGLIEFTNYCKNNCYYCGIRAGNGHIERYRLSKGQILDCCKTGDELGFKTFVLQGGEDLTYSVEKMTDIIRSIKRAYPEHAITLSIGEKDYDTYLAYYEAGADRYLLRHETANPVHYRQLHPVTLSNEKRKQALADLKRIGYETGSGFMVGSPFQTIEFLADDMLFITELQPHMMGVGPFIPHSKTSFATYPAGTVSLTLRMIALLRMLLPTVLLPATTALGTLDPQGREKAIMAGANVVMPNLSPLDVREKYLLYNGKIATGLEAAESVTDLSKRIKDIGYQIVHSRGDAKKREI